MDSHISKNRHRKTNKGLRRKTQRWGCGKAVQGFTEDDLHLDFEIHGSFAGPSVVNRPAAERSPQAWQSFGNCSNSSRNLREETACLDLEYDKYPWSRDRELRRTGMRKKTKYREWTRPSG